MRIRWENGEESTTSISTQKRIINNIKRAQRSPSTDRRSSTKPPPPSAQPTASVDKILRGIRENNTPASSCHCCNLDLDDRPAILIGDDTYCFRCAKAEYPKRHDEARRRRRRTEKNSAPDRRRYDQSRQAFDYKVRERQRLTLEYADSGLLCERNKWLIVFAIAIPCGIALPIVGLLVALPVLFLLQPIWDRTYEARRSEFLRNNPPPEFNSNPPPFTHVPDPRVLLAPICNPSSQIGIGYNRPAILRRDNFTCQSCGCIFKKGELEVHHVMPRAKNGSDCIRNLVTLCRNCHFHEDWFDHVHIYNENRKQEKFMEEENFIRRIRNR